jgi:hypothetical protein
MIDLLQSFYLAQIFFATLSICVLSPHVLPCPFDGPIALFGGIISAHA